MVRQVVMLVLEGKNRYQEGGHGTLRVADRIGEPEAHGVGRPRPTQVVVDTEKVGETPLGVTPWSKEEGHKEIEDIAPVFQGERAMKLKREVVAAHERYGMILGDDHKLAKHIKGSLAETPPLTIEAARRLLEEVADELGGS